MWALFGFLTFSLLCTVFKHFLMNEKHYTANSLRLVRVKVFPENRYFPERKMFSCVWLHFKKCFEKYFLMFGCVLENTIENTFSTCCSHFLIFSWSPNEYIISFIPQNTNKTLEKIIKSGQTKARSQSARLRSARSQSVQSTHSRCRWCRHRAVRDAGDVGTVPSAMPMMSADGAVPVMSRSLLSFSPPSLSLSSIFQGRMSFKVKMETEIIFRCLGFEIRSTRNAFQFDRIWSNNQTLYFSENHFRNQFEVNMWIVYGYLCVDVLKKVYLCWYKILINNIKFV